MDSEDHKTSAVSLGHEGSKLLCHRCGWPFPNPHPSAKHRRAHKRHCGTIEGYKIINPEEHDHNLAVSDDEHDSDDEHSPSPKVVKENVEASGKAADKSNKSEDDVFSDAVTDFAESGISSRLEERFEAVKDKSTEQKGVDSDLHGDGSLKVDEIVDKNEESSNPKKSGEMPNPEPLLSGNSAEAVLIQDSNIQVQEDKLPPFALNSEEGKISEEDLCKDSIPEVVKHEVPSQTETLEILNASEGENGVIHSAEKSASNETVEVVPVHEIQEKIDNSVEVEVEEVSESTKGIEDTLLDESISTTLSAKHIEGSQTSDANNHVVSMSSSIDEKIEPKNSLDGGDNEGLKSDMNEKEIENMEFKESSTVDIVPTSDSVDKMYAPEDVRTTGEFKKGVDHGEEQSNSNLLETGDEKIEGSFMDVKAVVDSKILSGDSIALPSSFPVDTFAVDSEASKESSKESIQEVDTIVSDNNALPTASLEVPVSPIVSTDTIYESKEIVSSKITPEQSASKDSASLTTESEILSDKPSESFDTAQVSKLDHVDVSPKETSENHTPKVLEASPTSMISSGELDGITPSLKEPIPSPSDLLETCAAGDDKSVVDVGDAAAVESKSLHTAVDELLTKENGVNRSGSTSSQSDSLEANCGSVVSDTIETNSQKQRTEESRSDTFEPPSFMTLVQPGEQVTPVKEIEAEQNNQDGWFPSLKNVVNESEGRKKNEEIIAKVTNWSPGRQQHGPLKSLLNEVKSPKSNPALHPKTDPETKDNAAAVGAVISPVKDQETNKDVEEWNSPARYPIEVKKEKKKKAKSYWVPFVCCSSVHRDL